MISVLWTDKGQQLILYSGEMKNFTAFLFVCIQNLQIWVMSDEYVVVARADKFLSSLL